MNLYQDNCISALSNNKVENHSGIKWDEELEEYLIENKYPYRLINYPAMFGRVFGIQLDQKSNKWIGVADPDWEGTVESN